MKVPKHWLENPQIQEMKNAIQPELELAQDAIEDFWNQLFIDTATWSLPLWERDYGLTGNENDSIENRRSAVKSQMRGAQTVTLKVLQSIADAWSNDAIVYDTGHSIQVSFIESSSVPSDLKGMMKNLRQMTPAHLPIESNIVYPQTGTQYIGSVVQISDIYYI